MNNQFEIRHLDEQEIDQVNGGAGLIIAIAGLLVATYGAAYAAGYQAGKDRAEREKRGT